jgi:hypothetical protein
MRRLAQTLNLPSGESGGPRSNGRGESCESAGRANSFSPSPSANLVSAEKGRPFGPGMSLGFLSFRLPEVG